MKPILKKKYIKLFLVLLFTACFATLQAAPTLTLSKVDGICVSDCQITATATGVTGTATYSILNYYGPGQHTTPETNNVFDGLAPGSYTIGVYDATTAGTPVTATISVATSYVLLSVGNPYSGYSNDACTSGFTGTFQVPITTGGRAPFRIKITNLDAPYNSVEETTNRDRKSVV